MSAVGGISPVRHRDGYCNRHPFIGHPSSGHGSGLALLERSGIDTVRGPRQSRSQRFQFSALHFLRGGERQRVDKRDIARRLEIRESLEAPLHQGVGSLLTIHGINGWRRCNDAGQHFIATHRVGGSSHRHGTNERMLKQHALHLNRCDVLAASSNHVLSAIDEMVEPIGIA